MMVMALVPTAWMLFKNQITAQKTVEQNYEVIGALQQIKNILSDPANCTTSFGGLSPLNGVPTSVRRKPFGLARGATSCEMTA